jgi:hypothetical protein
MSDGAHHMFALVINSLGTNAEPIYKWLLGFLKQHKLLVKPHLPIWQNCLYNMDWKKKYCICKIQRVKFDFYDNFFEINYQMCKFQV